MAQEGGAGYGGKPGVSVGKDAADVPQCGGPQEGVHDCVYQNIRVGMAQQAPVEGDFQAAQD